MYLYLIRHGKSKPKELDPESGLTEEGIGTVKKSGHPKQPTYSLIFSKYQTGYLNTALWRRWILSSLFLKNFRKQTGIK
jgi:hypothetical protein